MPTITITTQGTGSQVIPATTDLVVSAWGPGSPGTAGFPYVEDDPEVPGNQGQAPTAGTTGVGGAFGRKNYGNGSATLYYGVDDGGVVWFNLGTNSSAAGSGAYRVGTGTSLTPASGNAFTQTYTTAFVHGAGSGGNATSGAGGTPDGATGADAAPNAGGSAGYGGGSGFPTGPEGDVFGTDPGPGAVGQLRIVYTLSAHALTSTNVATSAPSIQTSTLVVRRNLTSTNVSTAAPAVQTATLGQGHQLASTGVSTAAPAVSTATLGQGHALTATSVSTAAPALANSSIGQAHALTATALATAAPQLVSPSIAQRQALTANHVSTAAPAIATATLVRVVVLASTNVSTAAPQITSAAIGQAHNLVAVSVSTAAAQLGTPVFTGRVALTSTSISTGAPAIQSATVLQAHGLGSTAVSTGPPGFTSPALGVGKYNFTAVHLATAAPQIGGPSIGQAHALAPTHLSTAAPAIASATVVLGQVHLLAAGSISTSAPAIATATLTQSHALTATGLATAAPSILSPAIGIILTEFRTARPVEIGSAAGWTDQADGNQLVEAIDEEVPDDADWAGSPADPVDSVFRFRLGGWTAQSAHRGVNLRYRIGRLGGGAVGQTVRLYQGGGAVVGAGTLIGGPYAHSVAGPQTFTQAIDASLISNPNDLWVEVEAG